MHKQGYATSTIRTHLSAINFVHKISNLPAPSESFLIEKLLIGLTKKKFVHDRRLRITKDILKSLTNTLHIPFQHIIYLATMLKAMFSLAFHAFIRVGEMTSKNGTSHNIKVSQIVKSSEGFKITLKNFKHAPLNHTTILLITPSPSVTCPVTLLAHYLLICPKVEGPLFIFEEKVPISRQFFCKCLHQCLIHIGLCSKDYQSHSFRIGAATHAASQGISDDLIMRMGRWKSQAFLKYIRMLVLRN